MSSNPLADSLRPQAAEVIQIDESEAQLIERAKTSLSQSAWTVGECAATWTRLHARGRSDEVFGNLIGVSQQDVNKRRRVWERFGQSYALRRNLSWTHFREALAWPDADEILGVADEQRMSVAAMLAYRQQLSIHLPEESITGSPPVIEDGFEIPFPIPGEALRAIVKEGEIEGAIDVLEILPHADGEYFIPARLNLIDGDYQFAQRAVNRESVVPLLEMWAPELNLNELDWVRMPESPLSDSSHPLAFRGRWMHGEPSDSHWLGPLEFSEKVTVDNVWDEAFHRAGSDERIALLSDEEVRRVRKIVEDVFTRISDSSVSSERPVGNCPDCEHSDGELLGQSVCWEHKLCFLRDDATECRADYSDSLLCQAHLVLLEGFFTAAKALRPESSEVVVP